MAPYGRIGGNTCTKVVDVVANLVEEIERNIHEDEPRNSDVIVDNVGDIADILSNLFNSESSCAALVVASISSFGINYELTPRSYPPSQFCRYHCLFDNHLICN